MSPNSSPSLTPPRPERPARRGRWLLLLVPLVLGVGGVLLSVGLIRPGPGAADSSAPGPQSAPARAEPPSREPARPSPGAQADAAPLSPEEAEREAQRQLWQKRLERARFTLDSYRQATRYPPQSRPIKEEPDLVYPSSPERKQPLNKEQRDISLRLKQEKVFVAGDEVVRFFVGCENASTGQPLQCEVTSASAHPAQPSAAGQTGPVPLVFNDSGTQGDEVAGDGTWTTSFQPSRQGFAAVEGTLRVEFRVRANGSAEGGAFFDILFTPAPPATFTGKVREAVEQGSLQLYVGLQVRKPGRYVMQGRVDDEAGVPFAYVSFNEELQAGAREVRFTVFGLLIREAAPDFPLQLRDVDGFLLREDTDPDRELVKPLSGYVYTTREYTADSFSPDEWTSEERQRYLDEYSKDASEAQSQVDKLKGPPEKAPAP
ncbi:MAG: choice-of-anchor X domain-containing protein [Archangium sp.]